MIIMGIDPAIGSMGIAVIDVDIELDNNINLTEFL